MCISPAVFSPFSLGGVVSQLELALSGKLFTATRQTTNRFFKELH